MREVVLNIEKKMWAADDGTTFEKKKDCVRYENETKFQNLVDKNGQCIRGIYDDGLKELVEYYLDIKNNKIASCTELYLAKVYNDDDAEQVSAFCQMKEGNELDHWSCQFNDGRYLICIHTALTRMYGEDNMVFVIPYKDFRQFWSIMMGKVGALEDYKLPIFEDGEFTPAKEVKSPFRHFNEIIKEFGNGKLTQQDSKE